MAKLNMLLRAFDADELQLLVSIMENEAERAIEEGINLSETFDELKETIERATIYSAGFDR